MHLEYYVGASYARVIDIYTTSSTLGLHINRKKFLHRSYMHVSDIVILLLKFTSIINNEENYFVVSLSSNSNEVGACRFFFLSKTRS